MSKVYKCKHILVFGRLILILKADQRIEPLQRLCSFKREERRKKKLLAPYMWYRPADAPLFVPATPGSVLQKKIQEVTNRHMERLGMSVRVIETAGKMTGGAHEGGSHLQRHLS